MRYDETLKIKPVNAPVLYLNNAEYTRQQNNIEAHESAQKLDTSALSYDKEINGTDCVGLLLEHWRDVAGTGDEFRNFGTRVLTPTLYKQQMSINDVDEAEADSITVRNNDKAFLNSLIPPVSAPSTQIFFPNSDKNSKSQNVPKVDPAKPLDPYDNIGKYGGDQSDLGIGEVSFWFWVIHEDDDVYDLFDKYQEFKKLSRVERHDLLEQISNNGCTFAAMANIIFEYFKNRPEEFEKKLGFPMMGKDGDLNYRLLIVDIFLRTGYKIILDAPEGIKALEEAYFMSEDGFDDLNQIFNTNISNYSGLLNEKDNILKKAWETGESVITIKDIRTNSELFNSRLSYYCRLMGIDVDTLKFRDNPDIQTIKQALEKGNSVIFSVKRFNLEDVNGNIVVESDSGVGHMLTITDVTSDGRYVVSSWGEKYYYNPNKQRKDAECYNFYSINFKKSPTDFGMLNKSLYDDIGTYGGRATAIKEKYSLEELISVIKKYPGYSNCTEEDAEELIKEYIKKGSSFVAMANATINAFDGNQKAFEEKFGIPMYRRDNEVNVDLLAFVFYMDTGSKVYFEDPDGVDCLADYLYKYCAEHPDEYKLIHNIDLYEGETFISYEKQEELKKRCKEEAEIHKDLCEKSGSKEMTLPTGFEAVGNLSVKNRLSHIYKERGIEADIKKLTDKKKPDRSPEIKDIKKALDNGYEVVLCAKDPCLRDINDNSDWGIYEDHTNIMTITGIVGEEGNEKYEVSCCGRKYYCSNSYYDEIYAVKIKV